MPRKLALAELNRTFLARQLLLKRHPITPDEAVHHLVGMQAQIPNPPYIGLWTRIDRFERDHLTAFMEQRKIVRAALHRSTLHLMTDQDYLQFRTTIEPALVKGLNSFYGQRGKSLDIPKLIEGIRPHLADNALSTGAQKAVLSELDPTGDPDAMAYAVRAYLPQVQVPPGGTWGSGSIASYTLAESYFGQAIMPTADIRGLFLRYLRSCGPASIMDFQTWVGITNLKTELSPLRDELTVYQNEAGKELWDVPNLPILSDETPAPIRFIPEYDNLLISHADRTRILAEEHRKKVFLSAARVLSTILVDGFVAATWKIERKKDSARLHIQPFRAFGHDEESQIVEEGDRLLRWVEDTATDFQIKFT